MTDSTTTTESTTTAIHGDRGDITIVREFDAPAELIFDCFFDPEHLSQFWGPTGVSTPLDRITIDARPGGVFETVMVNDSDGEEYPTHGVFIEIERPTRWSWHETAMDLVSSTQLVDLGNGRTLMTIRQTNAPAAMLQGDAQAGFKTSLDKFAAHLASVQA